MKYPVKLYERHDGYATEGRDADGVEIAFWDLVGPGDRVGQPVDDDPFNAFPPHGIVVERDGGLWIDAEVGCYWHPAMAASTSDKG